MTIKPNLGLSADGRILFSTRILRLFAYGLLSVILALYLSQLGLSEVNIGLLLTAILDIEKWGQGSMQLDRKVLM